MEMTQTPYDPPVAQATPVMGGAGPPAQAFPAGTLHKEGCGPLRCILCGWYVISLIVCAVALFFALKVTANQPGFSNI